MMSLVLSNKFKALLLDSYVTIKYELAIKSMKELIDKPRIELFNDKSFTLINNKTPELIELERRLTEKNLTKSSKFYIKVFNEKETNKLRMGQAVILCNSYRCPYYKAFNSHIELVYTKEHLFQSFFSLSINKYHSHSRQIYKL